MRENSIRQLADQAKNKFQIPGTIPSNRDQTNSKFQIPSTKQNPKLKFKITIL